MKFENTEVWGFRHALRGMRNPMDSWDKSDSLQEKIDQETGETTYRIGEKDLALTQKLIRAGAEHRKFLRQIFVSVDITAPRYWWSEFDTYKIGTSANSCSTMHKLASYPITKDMFEIEEGSSESDWQFIIGYLERVRLDYVKTKEMKYFRQLKQALPEAFLQKRTVTMNYENLFSMVRQRKNHRLSEWSNDFVSWVTDLPLAKELIFIEC